MKKFFKDNWKFLLFVLIGGLVGGYFLGLYSYDSLSPEMVKLIEDQNGTRELVAISTMLQYGITNAFQCDGGGSVQSICRNEDGVLDYAQSPYEGGYRPVLTGHFIAMKVENISLKIDDFDNHNATITVKEQDDQNNNLAHYYQEGFEIKAEGPIEIVGPSILSFKGGMTGTIIKTTHKTGKAKLIIKTQFETKEIEFNIE